MFAPNISTHQLADTIHHERISHAAMLQQIKQDRAPDSVSVDRHAHRRITSRRLAAAMAAALTFAIAAAVAANQPDRGAGAAALARRWADPHPLTDCSSISRRRRGLPASSHVRGGPLYHRDPAPARE